MERLGALPSAATFRVLVAVRNRITHVYPDELERQARNSNEAYAAVADLLSAHATLRRYIGHRMQSGAASDAAPGTPSRQ